MSVMKSIWIDRLETEHPFVLEGADLTEHRIDHLIEQAYLAAADSFAALDALSESRDSERGFEIDARIRMHIQDSIRRVTRIERELRQWKP